MEEIVAAAPPAAPKTIGERLRAGRERAGLSIAAAAEKLHLDSKVIEALEADRFNELGASVYVRGHLKRYGDFVGEAGTELVNSYTARDAKPPPIDLTQVPQAERRANPRDLVTPLVGLACAAVLLVAIWWVLAGSHGGGASTAAAPAAVPDGTVAPKVSDTAVVPAGPVVQTPEPVAKPAPEAATPKRDPNPNPDSAAPPARDTHLKLVLANDSWVEVYDSRGERLFYDVASANSVQAVTGKGPLRVVLGNVAGVTVEVDGRAREIPANAVDGEGARFVVNRSGSLARAR